MGDIQCSLEAIQDSTNVSWVSSSFSLLSDDVEWAHAVHLHREYTGISDIIYI
jgi:hypothetical protein